MSLLSNMQQLLDILTTPATFTNFISFKNEAIVDNLQNFSHQYTHIVGVNASGKSHLLKAWVNLATQHGKHPILCNAHDDIDIRELADSFNCIAIDDIDALDDKKQIKLFDLFNYIKLSNSNHMLLTSSCNKLENTVLRGDLKTRLLSGINLELHALNDNEIVIALSLYSNSAGIKIGSTEIKYLLTYYTRNLGELINLINQLAEIAVREKRYITVPLIKIALPLSV